MDLCSAVNSCVLARSCPTLTPTDCSPPASSAHGISQARILEWVSLPSSRGASRPRDQIQVSCLSCVTSKFFTTKPLEKPVCGLINFSPKNYPHTLWSIMGIPQNAQILQSPYILERPAKIWDPRSWFKAEILFQPVGGKDTEGKWAESRACLQRKLQAPTSMCACAPKASDLWGWAQKALGTHAWNFKWFLKKLKIELPYDPAIPLLAMYLDKNIILKDAC